MSKKIKFAHLADLHLGAFREKKLTNLNFFTFQRAIDRIIEENVNFCLFAGDIFNNAMPGIELVTKVIKDFMKLKEKNIPIYIIGGSHDYSESQKSFLDLLEASKIIINVSKTKIIDKNKILLIPTTDFKTNAKIYGVSGKRSGLDKNIYTNLSDLDLDSKAFNIFMFHSMLDDIKPLYLKHAKSEIMSKSLPKGFDYYAAGHVHSYIISDINGSKLSYPGALFPNNFSELKREKPSFNICSFDTNTKKINIKRIILDTYKKEYIEIDINGLNSIEARNKIFETIDNFDINEKIVLLKVLGVIEGKIADIELSKLIRSIYEQKKPLYILKNTYDLKTSLLETADVNYNDESVEEVENKMIKDNLTDMKDSDIKHNLAKKILGLEFGKKEGEKNAQYEERVRKVFDKVMS